MNVGQVQRVGELSLSAVARVRDQVDFRKPRLGHIPTVGFYRNVVLEQRPRFGLSVQALLALALLPRQPPVDLPRADAQQLPLRLRAGLVPWANPRHPDRKSTRLNSSHLGI